MQRNQFVQSPRAVIVAVLVTVITVFLIAVGFTALSPPDTVDSRTVQFLSDDSIAATVTVEIADTPDERKQGLMNRTELPDNHGMLFIFPNERPRTFWMKNTEIPLDIIFLDAQRRVINVEQANPEPDIPPENMTLYTSDRPAQYVIELEQGFAERHDIGPGTIAHWNQPRESTDNHSPR